MRFGDGQIDPNTLRAVNAKVHYLSLARIDDERVVAKANVRAKDSFQNDRGCATRETNPLSAICERYRGKCPISNETTKLCISNFLILSPVTSRFFMCVSLTPLYPVSSTLSKTG